MNFPIYKDIFNSRDWMTFQFESNGPKGCVWKVIQFTRLQKRGYYNLALGDWSGRDDLDFETVTDNGDHEKVLATVAVAIYAWSERFPRRKIIIQGSNAARTRLYRMAINKGWEELNKVFLIRGMSRNEAKKLVISPYDRKKVFEAYLVQRRPLNEFANPPP
jgi:hypothetical protein